MYAVIATGGKQYRVEEGQQLQVERVGSRGDRLSHCEAGPGSEVFFYRGRIEDLAAAHEARCARDLRQARKVVMHELRDLGVHCEGARAVVIDVDCLVDAAGNGDEQRERGSAAQTHRAAN